MEIKVFEQNIRSKELKSKIEDLYSEAKQKKIQVDLSPEYGLRMLFKNKSGIYTCTEIRLPIIIDVNKKISKISDFYSYLDIYHHLHFLRNKYMNLPSQSKLRTKIKVLWECIFDIYLQIENINLFYLVKLKTNQSQIQHIEYCDLLNNIVLSKLYSSIDSEELTDETREEIKNSKYNYKCEGLDSDISELLKKKEFFKRLLNQNRRNNYYLGIVNDEEIGLVKQISPETSEIILLTDSDKIPNNCEDKNGNLTCQNSNIKSLDNSIINYTDLQEVIKSKRIDFSEKIYSVLLNKFRQCCDIINWDLDKIKQFLDSIILNNQNIGYYYQSVKQLGGVFKKCNDKSTTIKGKKCEKEKICNPSTGNCVKKIGKAGRKAQNEWENDEKPKSGEEKEKPGKEKDKSGKEKDKSGKEKTKSGKEKDKSGKDKSGKENSNSFTRGYISNIDINARPYLIEYENSYDNIVSNFPNCENINIGMVKPEPYEIKINSKKIILGDINFNIEFKTKDQQNDNKLVYDLENITDNDFTDKEYNNETEPRFIFSDKVFISPNINKLNIDIENQLKQYNYHYNANYPFFIDGFRYQSINEALQILPYYYTEYDKGKIYYNNNYINNKSDVIYQEIFMKDTIDTFYKNYNSILRNSQILPDEPKNKLSIYNYLLVRCLYAQFKQNDELIGIAQLIIDEDIIPFSYHNKFFNPMYGLLLISYLFINNINPSFYNDKYEVDAKENIELLEKIKNIYIESPVQLNLTNINQYIKDDNKNQKLFIEREISKTYIADLWFQRKNEVIKEQEKMLQEIEFKQQKLGLLNIANFKTRELSLIDGKLSILEPKLCYYNVPGNGDCLYLALADSIKQIDRIPNIWINENSEIVNKQEINSGIDTSKNWFVYNVLSNKLRLAISELIENNKDTEVKFIETDINGKNRIEYGNPIEVRYGTDIEDIDHDLPSVEKMAKYQGRLVKYIDNIRINCDGNEDECKWGSYDEINAICFLFKLNIRIISIGTSVESDKQYCYDDKLFQNNLNLFDVPIEVKDITIVHSDGNHFMSTRTLESLIRLSYLEPVITVDGDDMNDTVYKNGKLVGHNFNKNNGIFKPIGSIDRLDKGSEIRYYKEGKEVVYYLGNKVGEEMINNIGFIFVE